MKSLIILVLVAICSLIQLQAQNPDPNSPIWGVYASGIGEKLSPCMDPCWVTYTVAMTTDPNIVANLGYGTMAAVDQNITWYEATAQQRRFGRYFDDEADGTWKCSPCEAPKPDLSCPWSSTYKAIHWNKGYYGTENKTIQGKLVKKGGMWVYEGTWGRTDSDRSGKVYFEFTSATSFKGYWMENGKSSKTTWTGSGSCK